QPHKANSFTALYSLSSQASHEAIHLVFRMLLFNPDKRISASDALSHPYIDEGRLRYHSCMCKCFHNGPSTRQYTTEFEPSCHQPFNYDFEDDLISVQKVKDKLHKFIVEQQQRNKRIPLCLNPNSVAFKTFAR
ncbi:hypothetical protein Ahia01_000631600, partial [Argonauta hians]